MRFFHLSDLHIGRQLMSYSLEEEQRRILHRIVELAKEHRPDAILIAGDIYDRSVPSAEAYTIFDDFLKELSDLQPAIPVLMIAGNHDNAKRLQYASSFLRKNQIYISVMPPQMETEFLEKIILHDEYGKVCFYLLPFTKPGYVRHLFPEEEVLTYDFAIAALIEREQIDTTCRNVLVSHQFYRSGSKTPMLCDSEQTWLSVGGLDSVDVCSIQKFDYAALGHIHGAQQVGEPRFRYCGTPLKYSVSEAGHAKSVTLVTLKEKGELPMIECLPLTMIHDVRKEKGLLSEVIGRAEEPSCHDYISVTLTDEKELYRPKEKLEAVFEHLLEVKIENQRTQQFLETEEKGSTFASPYEMFCEFFGEMRQRKPDEAECEILKKLFQEIAETEI